MEDIEHYDIPIYNFPYDVEEDDEETIIDNSELRVSMKYVILPLADIVPGTPSVCHYRLRGRS